MKKIKRIVLLKIIKKYPEYYKLHSYINRRIFIFFPFIKTEIKWRKLKKLDQDFEVKKILFNDGYLIKEHLMFDIDIKPGNKIDSKKRKNCCGHYQIKMLDSGIFLKGKLSEKSEIIFIKVNNTEIKNINLKNRKTFRFLMSLDLLKRLPETAVVTVETANNKKLVYNTSYEAVISIPFGSSKRFEKNKNSLLLNKKGGLLISNEDKDKKYEQYLRLYSNIKEIFDNETGTKLFITYGTLLGYIREGDFLKNDDDFDCGYISNKKSAGKVKKEALKILKILLKYGYSVRINQHGKLFKVSDNKGAELDIAPIWFKDDLTILYRGASCYAVENDFLPVKKGLLRNFEIYIPNNPHVFLSGYYGDNWKIPDPGYISYSKQTGICLRSEYRKCLLTPLEYKVFNKKILKEKNTEYGNLKSTVNF